jgi:nucleoside-diphosphate-sugar epimerase
MTIGPNTGPRKVLITGSNGFLGKAVVASLLREGERDLRCMMRPGGNTAFVDVFRSRYPDSRIEPFVGNLTSPVDCSDALADVATVYHLAAAKGGAPADMFLNTVVASKNLLEALVQKDRVRVVHVSSLGVYGVDRIAKGDVVTERTAVDSHPEKRDVYSHAKIWQETLFWDYRRRFGFPMVVVRPGVVYGDEGVRLAVRVGVEAFGVFLELGANNRLPLTYVTNCADAIVLAGRKGGDGEVYNVSDDDLPTCREYLQRYKRDVARVRSVRIPYFALRQLARAIEWYAGFSEGQLPAVLTPYKVSAMWKRVRIDNTKIKSLGWRPAISTEEGIRRTFASFRAQVQEHADLSRAPATLR